MKFKNSRIALLVTGINPDFGTNIYEISYLRYFAKKNHFDFKFLIYDNVKDEKQKQQIMHEVKALTEKDFMLFSESNAADFDILILPGGQGNVKLMTNYHEKKEFSEIDTDLQMLIRRCHQRGNYIFALGEGLFLLTRAFKEYDFKDEPVVAFGSEIKDQRKLETFGFNAININSKELVADPNNKFITALGMYFANQITDIFEVIETGFKELSFQYNKKKKK